MDNITSNVIVSARSLKKSFGTLKAVNGVSFNIIKGECVGFLGPNGAGKTTTIKMMYGAAKAEAGELFVLGLNVELQLSKIKQKIGILPQENYLDTDFSTYDNLMLFALYQGLQKDKAEKIVNELIHQFKLNNFTDQIVETLSGGTQRKIALARTIINAPDILFLDEPSTGLDPQARLYMWDLISFLKSQGKTIVLSTHYMEEAHHLCDRILMFDKGNIITSGTPTQLIANNVGFEVAEFKVSKEDKDYFIKKLAGTYYYFILSSSLRVFLKEGQNRADLLKIISTNEVNFRRATLDDVFLKVAGYELSDFYE